MNVTDNLGIGYELFEVRNEHGLKPIHRLGDTKPRGTIESVREEVRLALMDLAELPLKLTRVWMFGFPRVDSIEN